MNAQAGSRIHRVTRARVALLLFATAAAGIGVNATIAQGNIRQRFAASFEEVSNSCRERRLTLQNATIVLEGTDDALQVSIPGLPVMAGTMRRGKFRVAAASKSAGGESRFSAVGRAGDGQMQLVLVAEYYRGPEPECTQTWDVVGAPR
jgi:hypothetical protein